MLPTFVRISYTTTLGLVLKVKWKIVEFELFSTIFCRVKVGKFWDSSYEIGQKNLHIGMHYAETFSTNLFLE